MGVRVGYFSHVQATKLSELLSLRDLGVIPGMPLITKEP